MTRWVPAPERRERPRPRDTTEQAHVEAYRTLLDPSQQRNGRGWQLVRHGAVGLALVGVAGWLWKSASAGATADGTADKAGGASRAEKDPQ